MPLQENNGVSKAAVYLKRAIRMDQQDHGRHLVSPKRQRFLISIYFPFLVDWMTKVHGINQFDSIFLAIDILETLIEELNHNDCVQPSIKERLKTILVRRLREYNC